MSKYDTSTQAGRDKRSTEIAIQHIANHRPFPAFKLVGGSIADFDERYDASMSGSHPDDR